MQEKDQSNQKQLKGFYGKAKVSVKALDVLIAIGVVALFCVLTFAMQHRGYTITFDSTGGTIVESQTKMYGEYIDEPEIPVREGHTFEYWAEDANGEKPWDMAKDTVSNSMTLYAHWKQE